MEKNINLAKILNGKPVNTKLWSPLFGDAYTSSICSEDTIIVVNHHAESFSFYNNGKYFDYAGAEPLLFPSKEMRDWGKFAWKPGDVLVNKDGNVHIIFDGFEDDTYKNFHGKNYLWEEGGSIVNFEEDEDYMQTSDFNKANKEDAQEYIHKIEKELGGKLNLQTLEIEKQLEFKDGDIVVYGKSVAICRKIYKHTLSFYVSLNEMFGLLFADEVESSEEYRFATEEEKQQLFDALEKEGKAWDAEKKAMVDLPKKCEFKAMDWCLMRDKKETWKLCQFSFFDDGDYEAPYNAVGGNWFDECIPYNEETKHLLGTTDEWKGGEE